MDPLVLASIVVILLFSVIVHEVMHGVAALYFGDETAKKAGRLTLNPIPHIDPVGSILLPAILLFTQSVFGGGGIIIGWAKPVPVNPLNFKDYKRGELVTSAAGVVANIVLAITASILFHLFINFSTPSQTLITILVRAAQINLTLAFFNLLPIPPLDGSKIVMSLLPDNLARDYSKLEQYGPFILLALIAIPGLGSIFFGLISYLVTISLNLLGFYF